MSYQYKREPLTQEETKRLSDACQTHEEKLVVWTLLDTGLRLSELVNLRKENVGSTRRWPFFGPQMLQNMIENNPKRTVVLRICGKGSESKRREIPLSSRTGALIQRHFALHDSLRMGIRTIQRLVKRVAKQAHISRPVTPDVLRHSFTVNWVRDGLPLPWLQQVLGHESLATTRAYLLSICPEEVVQEYWDESYEQDVDL